MKLPPERNRLMSRAVGGISLLVTVSLLIAVAMVSPETALAQSGAHPPLATPVPGATRARTTRAVTSRRAEGRKITRQDNEHGLGLSGGWAPGSGFAYRRFFGKTSLQATLFAMVTERGADATVFAGLSATHYLIVWHRYDRPGLLPGTSALRITGAGSYLYRKSSEEKTTKRNLDPTCVDLSNNPCKKEVIKETVNSTKWDAFVGAGVGFEFGAVMRPGFSMSLDLMLTAMFDDKGLDDILPVPALGLLYNW